MQKKSSVQFYDKVSVQLTAHTGLAGCLAQKDQTLVNNVHEKALRIVSDDHNCS